MNEKLSKPIKEKWIWDSTAEGIAFECLHEIINTDSFEIFPHILVSEVFTDYKDYDYFKKFYISFCQLSQREEFIDNHFELTHFDFVIYNKSQYLPVLIIEVDGKEHRKRESTKHFDALKNFLADRHEIPLVRLEAYNKIDIKQELLFLLRNVNLHDPYKYPVYCHECGKRFSYQKNGDFYYCDFCQKMKPNVTLTNKPENCPHILRMITSFSE